jgi:hypothetical protein
MHVFLVKIDSKFTVFEIDVRVVKLHTFFGITTVLYLLKLSAGKEF